MEEKQFYHNIQRVLEKLPDNFSILEEQVDVELQMEYFNYGRDMKAGFSGEMIMDHKDDLFSPDVSVDEKKNLLVLLASQEKVEAFRTIEKNNSSVN